MKKEVLKELTAKPGKEHHVSDFNPSFTADMSKQDAKEQLVQNIVDFIIQNCTNVEENLQELYRRVAFNICIGNSDDHFRNHGFLLVTKGLIQYIYLIIRI